MVDSASDDVADGLDVGWIGSVSSHRTKAADSCRHPSAVCLPPPGYCSEGRQAASVRGWGQTAFKSTPFCWSRVRKLVYITHMAVAVTFKRDLTHPVMPGPYKVPTRDMQAWKTVWVP
jgi:hypothetical protein